MEELLYVILGKSVPATDSVTPVLNHDSSGIFLWVFLGFCALIVVSQIVPALLLMFGMTKGIGSEVKEGMAPAKK